MAVSDGGDGGDGGDDGGDSGDNGVITTPDGLLQPTIDKTVNPSFAIPGQTVTWTITVRNPNTEDSLGGVLVTDNMPVGTGGALRERGCW